MTRNFIARLGTALALVACPMGLTATLAFAPAAEAATTSPLGDLGSFRKIVIDTQALVDKGSLPAATARIKDLELAWDEAEAGLKPRNAATWHRIDKSIDRALAALRAKSPNAAECSKALAEVIVEMDRPAA